MLGEFEASGSGSKLGAESELRVWLAIVALAVDGVAGIERLLAGDAPWTLAGQLAFAHAQALVAGASGRTDEAARLFAATAEGWQSWGSVPLRAYALLGLAANSADTAAGKEADAIFASLGGAPVGASTAPARQQQV